MSPCSKASRGSLDGCSLSREGRKIAAALEAGGGSQRPDIDPITLSIEAKLRRAGKGKRLVIENGAEAEVNAGLAMVASISALFKSAVVDTAIAPSMSPVRNLVLVVAR